MRYNVMANSFYDNTHIDMNKSDFVKQTVDFMNRYSYTVTPKSKMLIT